MKKVLKVILIILGVLGLLILAGLIVWNVIDRSNGSLISSGEQREYLLYVPESYDPAHGIEYYRDEQGIHHVPKRGLDELILHW